MDLIIMNRHAWVKIYRFNVNVHSILTDTSEKENINFEQGQMMIKM